MSMLRGFLVLVVFFLVGEALRVMLALPVSGGVLGMMMLTLVLMLKGTASDSLVKASQGLISVLVLLIMPGLVGVFFQVADFKGQWLAIFMALTFGTLLSVLTTLLLMRRFTVPVNAVSGAKDE